MGRYDMTKQQIKIRHYWEVIVYYDVDYSSFYYIDNDLRKLGVTANTRSTIYDNMISNKAKAVTFSNESKCKSIILFNKHKSMIDYVNSIVHEAEHVKQAMLGAYDVEDKGEEPAYTIGYLVSRMWKVVRCF
jgi:hypothetical protein